MSTRFETLRQTPDDEIPGYVREVLLEPLREVPYHPDAHHAVINGMHITDLPTGDTRAFHGVQRHFHDPKANAVREAFFETTLLDGRSAVSAYVPDIMADVKGKSLLLIEPVEIAPDSVTSLALSNFNIDPESDEVVMIDTHEGLVTEPRALARYMLALLEK